MLRDQLDEIARSHGCVGFGVTTADAFTDVAATMQERHRQGLSANLAFTYTDTDTSTQVRATHPWAMRIVSVAHPYVPGTAEVPDTAPGSMSIARFAETDHYIPLRAALDAVAAALDQSGYRTAGLA